MKRKFTLFSFLGSSKPAAQAPTFKLPDSKAATISNRLNSLILSQRPYLNVGYSIRQMADDIDMPSYLISAYLNQEVGLTFTDYINRFRVEHFKWLIRSGEAGQFTLTGLAARSGFGNRNTLTTAFKKLHGLTPSDFCRQAKRA
jgi:AraC-like DNA-binding protein